MAARVESQAGGAGDGARPSIPSAFKNHLQLGATEAIMWIACRRRFSHEMIREHLERRTRNLRRHTGSEENPRLQVSPALSNRVDKAERQLFRLIIGGVPAVGTLDDEGHPDHKKRISVPVEFLKDGAYIDLLSGHLRADPLLEKHSLYQRRTYLDVEIDRDAFFKALAAAEPRSQATNDKPIELADASLANGQEDAPAQTLPLQREDLEKWINSAVSNALRVTHDPVEPPDPEVPEDEPTSFRDRAEKWEEAQRALKNNENISLSEAAKRIAGGAGVDSATVERETRRIRQERKKSGENC